MLPSRFLLPPALVVFTFAALAASTQNKTTSESAITATLIGHTVNAAGMPVIGAAATIENLDTHQRQASQSETEGKFQFTQLPAGNYRLEVAAPGYRTFFVPRFPLVAGDAATANIVLEPGNPADQMMGPLTSVISRMGTALAGKSVSDLPENQRNFVNLVQVSAGANEGTTNAAASGTRPGAQHQSSAVSLGGQSQMANNSLLDGIDNNERINSQIIVHPSVEGIDTVQILANAYPASMGKAGGGVINVISKSGTDKLHGSLYEYFRNDLLDAFPYQFGADNPKPELRQNQYGGSLGGPLLRQKTYFFVDYEGFRLVQGSAPLELTVPTAYEHSHPGDFTDVGGPRLSPTSIDPAGLAYFLLYPLPNVPGASNQFVSAPSGSNDSHTGDIRIDQRFSDKDQFFSRFSINQTQVYIPGQFPAVEEDGIAIQPGGSLTSFAGHVNDSAMNAVLDYTHVFSPHLDLNLRGGYTFWDEVATGLNPGIAVNEGFGQTNVNAGGNGLAPIQVSTAAPLGTDGYFRPMNQLDNVFQYGGALNWQHGSHSIAFGAELVRRQWSQIGSSSGLGVWTVEDLPSLLQGNFSRVQQQLFLTAPHYRTWEPSAYVQDTWQAVPSLTLDLGLRYDFFSPPTEVHNYMSNFDLATGRIVLAGQNGVSDAAGVKPDYKNFEPRFGFAWKAAAKTTVRGGYGITYFRPLDWFVYSAQPFIYTYGACSSETCPSGYRTLAEGLPLPHTQDPDEPTGILPNTRAFNLNMSEIQQFNLGLQQQFAGNTVGVFYVGSLGRHIVRNFQDYNAPPPNTSPDADTLRPFYSVDPNLTAVGHYDTEGSSSYNPMQASFAHTYRNGLTAHLDYTWAHGLDNVSAGGFGTVPAISSKIDYGNSSFDIRHRFVATAFYDVPFGKNSKGLKGWWLRGWQLNVSAVWSSGLPFTVLNANDVSNTEPGAYAADRPNQIITATLPHPTAARYFNTNAFVAQAPGTLGNEASNQLYGPPNRRLDASVFKNITLPNEMMLQFRTEVFNVTNTADFAAPNAVLGGANFGQLTQLTAGYTPREIQLALRLQF